MEYVVWQTVPLGDACLLDPIRNAAPERDLLKGLPFVGAFSSDAYFPMRARHKKETGLIDDIMNMDDVKVCSKRLVDFLAARDLVNVEYLPVKIVDHEGKVATTDYCIVHPVDPQPALDLSMSEPTYSHLAKDQIVRVRRLALEVGRVDPRVRIFRLDAYFYPVLVDKELAVEIEDAGFLGPWFVPLDEYEP